VGTDNHDGSLQGRSGKHHQFDFVGRKPGERLIIAGFEAKNGESNAIELVKLRVKTLDTNPTTSLVIFQSRPSQKDRSIAEECGYEIIAHDESLAITDEIKDLLMAD
jgi:hypothetical protein